MSTQTTLNRSPPGEMFIEGMDFGVCVDAITGEFVTSAVDSSSISKTKVPSSTGDTFSFALQDDVRQTESSSDFGYSSSVTFPVEGLNVTAKSGLDFTDGDMSSGRTLLIVLKWEHTGKRYDVGPNVKLHAEAKSMVDENPSEFRKYYGDYFVHSMSYKASFVAVWKCTANTTSELSKFKASLNTNVTVPGDIGGSGGFEASLQKAASANGVSVTVEYDVIGESRSIFNPSDPVSALNDFMMSYKPVPSIVYYRHIAQLDSRIPHSIEMDPDVFQRLCDTFARARFVLLLNGIAPGGRATRINRRENIKNIFKTIYARRAEYLTNPDSLKKVLNQLDQLRSQLLSLLDREDLVTDLASLTYQDLKKQFQVDHENVRGAWVQAVQGKYEWTIGRTQYNNKEEYANLGIKYMSDQYADNGMGCKMSGVAFNQVVGAVSFPASSDAYGTVVGIIVQAKWTDGTDGYWCIPRDNPLGQKNVKIEVKSFGSRGIDWGLGIYYIPLSEYDG